MECWRDGVMECWRDGVIQTEVYTLRIRQYDELIICSLEVIGEKIKFKWVYENLIDRSIFCEDGNA